MKEYISYLSTIFIIIPIFMTIILYSIIYFIKRHRWITFHLSAQLTAVFYIIAVAILAKELFNDSFIGYILIILIIQLGIILITQRVKQTKVDVIVGVKLLFRINFLLFFIFYFGLFMYWLIQLLVL